MKQLFFIGFSLIFIFGCVSTNKPRTDSQSSVDPLVQKWLKLHENNQDEHLSVIIKTSKPVVKYPFLHESAGNYYTGNLNASQIKRLLLDPCIIRISAGEQKLYAPAKPQAPAQPANK